MSHDLGILDITKNSSHLVDHIPNDWVMWNMGTWLMTHDLIFQWFLKQIHGHVKQRLNRPGVAYEAEKLGAERWDGRFMENSCV